MSSAPFRSPTAGPSWLVLQLLERCNLRCHMCYEWGDGGSFHVLPDLAELDEDLVLRTLEECRPVQPYVELFGGEPLLYKGVWRVIDAIHAGGSQLVFPTNGTTLRSHADRLVSDRRTRVWVSVDGPRDINDVQRGAGVYDKAMAGIDAVDALKRRRGVRFPEIGITYLVTPDNAAHISDFFKEVDLSKLGAVSLELQSFATADMHRHYGRVARDGFGVPAVRHSAPYIRSPRFFESIDVGDLVRQMIEARDACLNSGVKFFSRPAALETDTVGAYLRAEWSKMKDYHERCAVPWRYAEISARGEVTTCHTFYDVPLGNIYESSLLDIWQGDQAKKVRKHLRSELWPICPTCTRYYSLETHPV
ncbi:SPASM domain-containing protein [Streptomyces sp. NPDC127079]|uniref:radical SAM protein n=1 Tax=Streptomyces sp. NPDC127079 TaxID=3347132 RepID=UPI00364E70B8